jgi:hypothetical protein
MSEPPNGEDAMTVTAMPGTGQRHRVVAIGCGFGRLTATKALKHAGMNMTDALTFLTRTAARGTAHVHNQTSLWLHVIPTTAAVFTTAGVLITLYVAIIRERKREISTAARYFSCGGRPRRSRDGHGKVGTDHAIHRVA